MGLMVRLLICVCFTGLILYKYIDNLNELTELQLRIPAVTKEVKDINEKNLELQYEIERFESPIHLMELVRKPEFGHLKHPSMEHIIILPESHSEKMDHHVSN